MTNAAEMSDELDPGVEEDLRELQLLLPGLFRALRHGGPDLREVEPLKQRFFDAGLRERHGRLLMVLASSGPITVGELASRVALAPATTSLLVGELDRAGFVERHEDDADRRRTIVSLPEAHRAAMEQFSRVRLAPMRRALEQLEPDARRSFLAGLRLLSAEFERSNGPAAECPDPERHDAK